MVMAKPMEKRQQGLYGDNTCYDSFGNAFECNGPWYTWGRWVLVIAVAVTLLALFVILSCLSARRRRRQGLAPRYGTGWTGKTPWGHAPAQQIYDPNYAHQHQQHYTYANLNENYTGNSNAGYYGGGYQSSQPTGHAGGWNQPGPPEYAYEMQPPGQTYGNARREHDDDGWAYQPPAGPPPKKY